MQPSYIDYVRDLGIGVFGKFQSLFYGIWFFGDIITISCRRRGGVASGYVGGRCYLIIRGNGPN